MHAHGINIESTFNTAAVAAKTKNTSHFNRIEKSQALCRRGMHARPQIFMTNGPRRARHSSARGHARTAISGQRDWAHRDRRRISERNFCAVSAGFAWQLSVCVCVCVRRRADGRVSRARALAHAAIEPLRVHGQTDTQTQHTHMPCTV